MKKLSFIIPIMLIVASVALWKLATDYAEIAIQTRILIAAGAAVLSGIISYFLFPVDEFKKKK